MCALCFLKMTGICLLLGFSFFWEKKRKFVSLVTYYSSMRRSTYLNDRPFASRSVCLLSQLYSLLSKKNCEKPSYMLVGLKKTAGQSPCAAGYTNVYLCETRAAWKSSFISRKTFEFQMLILTFYSLSIFF